MTTIDLTDEAKKYLDFLVNEKNVRSAREAMMQALEYHKLFHAFEWTEHRYLWNGFRKLWVGERVLEELMRAIPEEKLLEIGQRTGRSMVDYFLREADIRDRKHWHLALDHMMAMGWGTFEMVDGQIIVHHPGLPRAFLHGYLQTSLDVNLESEPTEEDLLIFHIAEPNRRAGATVASLQRG